MKEVKDALDHAAEVMVEYLNTERWGGWIDYLLQDLDNITEQSGEASEYEVILARVRDDIERRLSIGMW